MKAGDRLNIKLMVGDVGATKAIFALAEKKSDKITLHKKKRYSIAGYSHLSEMIRDYCRDQEVDVSEYDGVFGVAGLVRGQTVKMTNTGWVLEETKTAAQSGLAGVKFCNDLEAIAAGVPCLGHYNYETLQTGKPEPGGTIAVIAPGTGLGEAYALSCNGRVFPFATEAGHAEFSPRTSEELELLQYFMEQDRRLSLEDLLSGNGLVLIHDYIQNKGCYTADCGVPERLPADGKAAAITSGAMEGRDPLLKKTVEMFCSILGTEAGNLALRTLPFGGLYLAGGIVPKIVPKLKNRYFFDAFHDKGKMTKLMSDIPVHILITEDAPLYGAAMIKFSSIGDTPVDNHNQV